MHPGYHTVPSRTGCTGVYYAGGVWVGGCGEGNTGTPSHLLEERSSTSEAGPVGPARAGVGGYWSSDARAVGTHPCGGPVGLGLPALPGSSQIAASWPITARIDLIYCKVSQNGQVSPKYSHKACHSPCSQNASQKSPLGILRFPVFAAFSPKELMVPF